tara:strand:- start:16761 stop:17792 length:1032 start_codon:yes stop_codon:yes gene_type:complete
MLSFIRNKTSRLKLYYGLTILMALSLLLGCVFVLTGSNIFAFTFSISFPILALLNMVILLYWSIKKSRFLFVPLLGLIVFFLCFSSFVQFNVEKEKLTDDSFSLLTYNVRGLNENNEINQKDVDKRIVGFVEDRDTDIVMFQEFSYSDFRNFETYPYHFLGYREGVAKSLQLVLSKFPIVNKGYVDFTNTLNNAMFVDVEYKEDVIRIYNVHLQSFSVKLEGSKSYANRRSELFKTISIAQKMRIDQVEMIMQHSKNFKGPIIICGDFNSTQFSSTYKSLKKGRKDTFVEAGFGLGTTYNLLSKYPLRLDYVLVDDTFEVVSHENFELKLSDHEPVLVELIKN